MKKVGYRYDVGWHADGRLVALNTLPARRLMPVGGQVYELWDYLMRERDDGEAFKPDDWVMLIDPAFPAQPLALEMTADFYYLEGKGTDRTFINDLVCLVLLRSIRQCAKAVVANTQFLMVRSEVPRGFRTNHRLCFRTLKTVGPGCLLHFDMKAFKQVYGWGELAMAAAGDVRRRFLAGEDRPVFPDRDVHDRCLPWAYGFCPPDTHGLSPPKARNTSSGGADYLSRSFIKRGGGGVVRGDQSGPSLRVVPGGPNTALGHWDGTFACSEGVSSGDHQGGFPQTVPGGVPAAGAASTRRTSTSRKPRAPTVQSVAEGSEESDGDSGGAVRRSRWPKPPPIGPPPYTYDTAYDPITLDFAARYDRVPGGGYTWYDDASDKRSSAERRDWFAAYVAARKGRGLEVTRNMRWRLHRYRSNVTRPERKLLAKRSRDAALSDGGGVSNRVAGVEAGMVIACTPGVVAATKEAPPAAGGTGDGGPEAVGVHADASARVGVEEGLTSREGTPSEPGGDVGAVEEGAVSVADVQAMLSRVGERLSGAQAAAMLSLLQGLERDGTFSIPFLKRDKPPEKQKKRVKK